MQEAEEQRFKPVSTSDKARVHPGKLPREVKPA